MDTRIRVIHVYNFSLYKCQLNQLTHFSIFIIEKKLWNNMNDTLNEEATASENNHNGDDDGTTSPHSASPSDLYLCTTFTTKSCSIREPIIFMREEINLESHQLVWLDATIENRDDDNPVVIKELRQIIGYTKIFDNTDECLSYIKHTDISITTFLVCSGHLGRLIVPQVCDFKIFGQFIFTVKIKKFIKSGS